MKAVAIAPSVVALMLALVAGDVRAQETWGYGQCFQPKPFPPLGTSSHM